MAPKVSIIMANRDRAEFLEAAIRSVQAQSDVDWELVLADDGSTDRSISIARRLAEEDPRLRILTVGKGEGPSAARNRAIESAKGEWLAIVDSDDLLEPGRFSRLLMLAEEQCADAVADDLLYFSDPETEGSRLLAGYRGIGPWLLGAEEFLQAHILRNRLPKLGYLKPMFRKSALGKMRYDESLRIGEDSDLLLRFIMAGRRVIVTHEALYRYRRHAGSISYRWKVDDLNALISSQRRQIAMSEGRIAALMVKRLEGLERTAAIEMIISHLKNGRYAAAVMRLAIRPSLVPVFAKILGRAIRNRTAAVGARA